MDDWKANTMTVEIPPELEQFVRNVVDRGIFNSESEVIGEALRLLQERQGRLEQLREEIKPALERLDRGEGIQLDDDSLGEFFDDVKARGRDRFNTKQSTE